MDRRPLMGRDRCGGRPRAPGKVREEHGHALALVVLARRGPHHLALLAVLDPVATLEGLTRPRVVDLLTHRVAARQRRWRFTAHLCAHTPPPVGCDGPKGGAAGAAESCGWLRGGGGRPR